MIALAERFGLKNGLQRTMSAVRAQRAAQDADGPAYAEAVSAYAGLDADGLLPAITFVFSRVGCDAAVGQCLRSSLRLMASQPPRTMVARLRVQNRQ